MSTALLSTVFTPMKAQSGELPDNRDDHWRFELKWDGMRAIVTVAGGEHVARSGNRIDITGRFPELADLAASFSGQAVVLDGELVAFDAGQPSFSRLQQRIHLSDPALIEQRSAEIPVSFVVFDVLHHMDRDWTGFPYEYRRALLEELVLPGPTWRLTDCHAGDGSGLLEAVSDQRLEGLVAKHLTSSYEQGRRSRWWRKVKVRRRQEFAVCGWQPGKGGLTGSLGSLMLCLPTSGGWRFVGGVGSGLNESARGDLQARLTALAAAESPCADVPAAYHRRAMWVEPTLVAEVAFGGWTPDGLLRHPVYVGLRLDADPAAITVDSSAGPA